MKAKLYPKLLLIAFVAIKSFHLAAQDQTSVPPLSLNLIPNYDETGRKLPPGVPRTVDTNGNVLFVPHRFTTKAFQKEALRMVIQEANQVAQELRLSEKAPITQSNLVEYFVGPFGFSYAYKKIGNITTKNYMYGVEEGNKFSDVTVANYDKTCFKLRDQGTLPMAQIDTNSAYQLATQWLSAVSMDVKGLNQNCKAHIALSPFWNGLARLGDKPRKQFVPIYCVWWTSPENDAAGGSVASIELFTPNKSLLQLTVQDPKYILRKPLVFTNLAALFPGVAPIHTNYPVKTIYMPAPPPE